MGTLKYLIKPHYHQSTVQACYERSYDIIPINIKPVKPITKKNPPLGGAPYNSTKFYEKRKEKKNRERKEKKKKKGKKRKKRKKREKKNRSDKIQNSLPSHLSRTRKPYLPFSNRPLLPPSIPPPPGIIIIPIVIPNLPTGRSPAILPPFFKPGIQISADDPLIQLGAADVLHGVQRILVRVVLDEAEAARGLGEAVEAHDQPLDLAALAEEFVDLLLRGVEGEVADVEG